MIQSSRSRCWKLSVASYLVMGGAITLTGCFAIASLPNCALAQITPDTTLPNNSIVIPSGNTRIIEGGTQAGSNLFHSFEQFSVPTGTTAYFNNALDIQNIMTRVTGSSISNIDGLIRANGTANLFVINPNGIIFGSNAKLNFGGSFLASTASSLKFADGTEFSANTSKTTPLLTISVPIGLQYGGIANRIHVQGAALAVESGKMLAIVGGNVSLDGGNLQAPGGQVELGGVLGEGTVGLNFTDNNLSLSFPDTVVRTDVSLTNRAVIDVRAGGGGSIAINARNLNILGRSRLSAGIGQGLGSVGSQAGDITLNATEAITIGNSSIENVVDGDVTGNGGDISIKAGSLLLTDVAKLSTTIPGQGDAGNISVQSNGDVSLVDSRISSVVIEGNTGSISVQANGSVSFSNKSSIYTNSILGKGNAGSISVQANGSVSFSNNSIYTDADEGNAGNISVRAEGNILSNTLGGRKAGNIINFENTSISTSTSSEGNAGNILVQANGNIAFISTDISTKTSEEGNSGNISVQANGDIFFKGNAISTGALVLDSRIFSRNTIPAQGNISVQANGNITFINNGILSNTSTKGDAGNISVQANGNIDFKHNTITSDTSDKGDAGDILIQAGGNVSFVDKNVIVSSTSSKGNAGNITVQADSNVSFASGFISSASGFPFPIGGYSEVEGNGGDIHIQSRSLSVTDGAIVSATTYGKGEAGNIQVEALDSVTLSGINPESGDSSGLFTDTEEGASRQGGDIKVQTPDLRLINGAVMSARTRSDFDGGNITVNANTLSAVNGGQMLTSTSGGGQAGDITVSAKEIQLSGSNSGLFAQTSSTAPAGNLTLQPLGEGQTLRINFFDGAQISASTSSSGKGGNLTITAPESITLTGNGSLISAETSGSGTGGDLTLKTGTLTVRDEAKVTVSSTGTGDAGNLNVTANLVLLDNGELIAQTASGEGGNIYLKVDDLLLMRNSSLISAEAGNNGNGGNIDMDARLIVAVPKEDSDIVADADKGNGGNINITTSGIFGLEYRQERTPQSDITASSRLGISGTVNINQLTTDPSQGLTNLPTEVVDASNQMAQYCRPGEAVALEQSSFVVTGRGGLPPNPNEALSSDDVVVNWVPLNPEGENSSTPTVSTKATNATPAPLVEAQGWVMNDLGQVVLTASAPSVTPHSPWQKPTSCGTPQSASGS